MLFIFIVYFFEGGVENCLILKYVKISLAEGTDTFKLPNPILHTLCINYTLMKTFHFLGSHETFLCQFLPISMPTLHYFEAFQSSVSPVPTCLTSFTFYENSSGHLCNSDCYIRIFTLHLALDTKPVDGPLTIWCTGSVIEFRQITRSGDKDHPG